ncbi:glycoside hydrolase family 13 protein [Cetobacterium sp.]|uniref:glycoside hydrolase family 13 protein n=1 Tax=Cetobacterium sp. TaxID=2071632 RepID=UPI003F3D2155
MWWKELVGYQVYPRSFKDSNGDGIGDLNGIIEKLDYLKELGIDLIWVSPFFKSPNDDNGYDISDYRDILEEFGNMSDFDKLLAETHKRDMKLIIDLVINHTSDEHPWFVEARESKDSPKRDWYIWREGKDKAEPNNWESIFKGSAWEHCDKTDEYYLHLFSKKQPDLNWENEEMRKEIYKMMNWWLDKGIDGFRVDAISHIKKVEGLPDMPNPMGKQYVDSFDMHMNVDGIQNYLKELKECTFDKYDIVTVGEANGVDAENSDEWVCSEKGKFNMIFQFEHLKLWDYEEKTEFCPKAYKSVLNKWQIALKDKGWNALFIENHDIPRSTSTWGNDREYWSESAKAFATAYFLQKGTPFIYQGQEIGMTNTVFNSISEFQDIKSINEGIEKLEAGLSEDEVLEILSKTSRDNSRTPMQWDDSENAGFSTGEPWLKVNQNYKIINVKNQIEDENSIYNYYKNLIELKKANKTLIHGDFKLLLEEDEHVFAYLRESENEKYLVLSNLSKNEKALDLSEFDLKKENIVLCNYEKVDKEAKKFKVRAYESVVYKI